MDQDVSQKNNEVNRVIDLQKTALNVYNGVMWEPPPIERCVMRHARQVFIEAGCKKARNAEATAATSSCILRLAALLHA